MNNGNRDYDLCGWRLASDIPLPDLTFWAGDARAPDVIVRLGAVPQIDSPVMSTPIMAIDATGRTRFRIDGVADYLVEEGRRITVDPARSAESPDVRLFLLGSAFGYLCHQRGVLPIHGASVLIDGEAIVLAGASGAGKSTLADAFARRGYAILSDDVSPVQVGPGGALVLPGLRRIRLWQDALDNAGWDSTGMERCREGLEKFSRSLLGEPSVSPAPPGAIFHLSRKWDKQGGTCFRRLRGRTAAEQLRRQIYRWRSLLALAGDAAALARTTTVAGNIPLHFIFERALAFDRLEEAVDDIVTTVRASR